MENNDVKISILLTLVGVILISSLLLIAIFEPNGCNSYNPKIVEFGYNDHDYIKFITNENVTIVHSPDCHCFKDSIK